MLDEFEEDPKDFELTPMEYVLAALAYAKEENFSLERIISIAGMSDTPELFDKNVTFEVKMRDMTRGKIATF
jgi:hypothetical protein